MILALVWAFNQQTNYIKCILSKAAFSPDLSSFPATVLAPSTSVHELELHRFITNLFIFRMCLSKNPSLQLSYSHVHHTGYRLAAEVNRQHSECVCIYTHTLRVLPIHFGRETVPSGPPRVPPTNFSWIVLRIVMT